MAVTSVNGGRPVMRRAYHEAVIARQPTRERKVWAVLEWLRSEISKDPTEESVEAAIGLARDLNGRWTRGR